MSSIGHPVGVPDPRLEAVLERSRSLGFLGPGGIAAHVANAAAFGSLIPEVPRHGGRLLDLGSGGGVPGLVVALGRPAWAVVLLDGSATRCAFLRDAVVELGLAERVTVAEGRAEELGRHPGLRGTFEVVTARSFAPPSVTAECAAAFLLAPGGRLLVSEPPTQGPGDPGRWPGDGLDELGLRPGGRHRLDGTTIQELLAIRPCGDRYPRRVGVPAKRPLF